MALHRTPGSGAEKKARFALLLHLHNSFGWSETQGFFGVREVSKAGVSTPKNKERLSYSLFVRLIVWLERNPRFFWSSGGFKSRGFNPKKQGKTIVLTIRSLDRLVGAKPKVFLEFRRFQKQGFQPQKTKKDYRTHYSFA